MKRIICILHLSNQRCRSQRLTAPLSSLQPSFLPGNLPDTSCLYRAYFAPASTEKPVPALGCGSPVHHPSQRTCSMCRRSVSITERNVLKGKKVSCAEFASLLVQYERTLCILNLGVHSALRRHCFDLEEDHH